MTTAQEQRVRIASAIPVLMVKDVSQAAKWYGENLGFETRAFVNGWMAIVGRGEAELMLVQLPEGQRVPTNDVFYAEGTPAEAVFRVQGLDDLYAAARERGLDVTPPTTRDYGLRDIFVRDCDGHLLQFNEPA